MSLARGRSVDARCAAAAGRAVGEVSTGQDGEGALGLGGG